MVGPDGALPLPWLEHWLAHALQTQRGHAVLIHGPQGIGVVAGCAVVALGKPCTARGQQVEVLVGAGGADLQLQDNTKSRQINATNSNKYHKNRLSKKIRAQVDIYNYLKTKHQS